MTKELAEIFSEEVLLEIFPRTRSDEFFDALYGDAAEGAYDICLAFAGTPKARAYHFELQLKQRPGKCLACNLTYGLPEVFSRHPLINIKGVAVAIAAKLGLAPEQVSWQLGATKSISKELYTIPLVITA